MNVTIKTTTGSKTLSAKEIGKLLRKFRDDCLEHVPLDLSTVTKKEDKGVGQLMAWPWLGAEDPCEEVTISTSESDRKETFCDKRRGKLLRKFRNFCLEHKVINPSTATKKDDVAVGELFIAFVACGTY